MDILKLEYKGKDNQLLKRGSKYEVYVRINSDCIVVSISDIHIGTYTSLSEFLKNWRVN